MDCLWRFFARGSAKDGADESSERLHDADEVEEAGEEASAPDGLGTAEACTADSQAEDELAPIPEFGGKPLTKATKSRVPGSFYVRDKSYRERKQRTVEPRSQGTLQARKVEHLLQWGGWAERHCVVRENRFLIYDLAAVSGAELTGKPTASINLIGTHLTVDAAGNAEGRGFCLAPAGSPPWTFLAGSHQELLEWLQFFTSVAGLYRRPEDFFARGRKLGEGATCIAYEATSRLNGGEFVLKVRVDPNNLQSTRGMHNELRILQKCEPYKHPAIPHLEDYFFDQDGKIAIVMEKFEGGELFDRVMGENHFTEQQARNVFRQIVDGVALLHSLGIAHRDLKPSNTLIRNKEGDPQVAIIDYDLAKVNHGPVWQASTPCGTTPYMAPEIVRHARRYGTGVDMWSLGCMLHVLLTGMGPFDGKTTDDFKDAIKRQQFQLTEEALKEVASPLACDLLHKLLAEAPEDRLTAAQCLQHPWLQAEEAQLPDKKLPAPDNVRVHFLPDEISNLSSENLAEAAKVRTKLRDIVDADHVDPPEGRALSMDGGRRSCDANPGTKRERHIESLKILLEEASALEDAGPAQDECLSANPSAHGGANALSPSGPTRV